MFPNSIAPHLILLAATLTVALARPAEGQIRFDREPIRYSEAEVNDPIARLQKRLDAGEVELEFDPAEGGYLGSVMEQLGVERDSQVLVFSKTSFQLRRISPRTPRAIYFSDDVYIGCVQQGDVLEFSAVDPDQGAIFYTLAQEHRGKPRFVRDQGNCLTCHASSRTHDVPGHLVRSVYTSASGMPHFGAGTFQTDHTSPLSERWGGWYVTGTHGEQRHMGNVIANDRDRPELLDRQAGANVIDLSDRFDTDAYLTEHSDIVALMVLEHQTEMHNLITAANYEARMAQYHDQSMNRVLERPLDYVSESTERRIKSAAADMVSYMLFSGEAELTHPIRGTSGFAARFAKRGPFDSQGRSLYQLDLQTRLFRYPCSYLIYSPAFQNLPHVVKQQTYQQLWNVLTDQNDDPQFAHLAKKDRQAILEILRGTLHDLPAAWHHPL